MADKPSLTKPGLAARQEALGLLGDVLDRRQPFDQAWPKAIGSGLASCSPRDRAFVRLMVITCLRRLGQADEILARLLHKALPSKAKTTSHILRLALTECLFLDTPAHAIVDSWVSLAAQDNKTRPYKKLINAVLRRVTEAGTCLLEDHVPSLLNTPDWLMESWRETYGNNLASAIADSHLKTPPVDLTIKDPAQLEAWAEKLNGMVLPTGSVRCAVGGQVETWPGYAEGAWWVQDTSAALPARLLGEISGQTVLDLCAAPGGKTTQLAAAGAKVIAVDRASARLQRLTANLERLGLRAEIVQADVATWTPSDQARFVLLDAPCSATGTLRRHPDVAYLKSPGDVEALAQAQSRLLKAAAQMTAPDGTLIYCTCSLQPEEGPTIVADFLEHHGDWQRAPIAPEEVPGLQVALTPDGALRTLPNYWPDLGGMDGFFVARLNKRSP